MHELVEEDGVDEYQVQQDDEDEAIPGQLLDALVLLRHPSSLKWMFE